MTRPGPVKRHVYGTVVCPDCEGRNPKCGHCHGTGEVNIVALTMYLYCKRAGTLKRDYETDLQEGS